jgi:hydrogenase expression/formation protein HypE
MSGDANILLGHGSGGILMHELIKNILLKKLGNPILAQLSDSALLGYQEKLAFSTDSFVVAPLFFPGADIGKLSVCGTVNDLVVAGASPEYLSLSFIAEEGLPKETLRKVVDSIALEAKKSGVKIVTGDFKVVERGAVDQLFINTSGVGRIIEGVNLSYRNIKPHDKIIITGDIGEHGLAVLTKRKELDLGFKIKSDCASLNKMLIPLLRGIKGIKFMRDPTRGGLATTLNEVAVSTGLGIKIYESSIPVSGKVRSACELLGIDPLYVANEGKAVIIVDKSSSRCLLAGLKKHTLGRNAREIGEVTNMLKGCVIMTTSLGTERIIDMLAGESIPRIC